MHSCRASHRCAAVYQGDRRRRLHRAAPSSPCLDVALLVSDLLLIAHTEALDKILSRQLHLQPLLYGVQFGCCL